MMTKPVFVCFFILAQYQISHRKMLQYIRNLRNSPGTPGSTTLYYTGVYCSTTHQDYTVLAVKRDKSWKWRFRSGKFYEYFQNAKMAKWQKNVCVWKKCHEKTKWVSWFCKRLSLKKYVNTLYSDTRYNLVLQWKHDMKKRKSFHDVENWRLVLYECVLYKWEILYANTVRYSTIQHI